MWFTDSVARLLIIAKLLPLTPMLYLFFFNGFPGGHQKLHLLLRQQSPPTLCFHSLKKFWSSWKYKSPFLPLFSSEGWRSCRGSRPEPGWGAGVWRSSMASSPLSERSVCHSPPPSVTPQSAVDEHSPLCPASLHPAIPSHTLHFKQKTCHSLLLNWC